MNGVVEDGRWAQAMLHFGADEKAVLALGVGGSEDVGRSSVGESEASAQFGDGEGEVAHGDVGAVDALEGLAELLFVEAAHGQDGEAAAGEGVGKGRGEEEVLFGLRGCRRKACDRWAKQPAFMMAALGS